VVRPISLCPFFVFVTYLRAYVPMVPMVTRGARWASAGEVSTLQCISLQYIATMYISHLPLPLDAMPRRLRRALKFYNQGKTDFAVPLDLVRCALM
jgi:hypothetical protein